VTDLLDRITADIDRRLTELRSAFDEHERLVKARAALGANGRPRTPSTTVERTTGRTRRAPAKSPGQRAPRGENRRRILDVVAERPGVSVAEIASVTGVKKTVTYATLSKLTADGLAEKVEVGSTTGYRVPKPANDE
jgi:sugar-specific transcriptional regulator TrmB